MVTRRICAPLFIFSTLMASVWSYTNDEQHPDPYFQIDSVETTVSFTNQYNYFDRNTLTDIGGDLVDATKVFDKMVVLGEKVWKIIEKGRPSYKDGLSSEVFSLHVIPKAANTNAVDDLAVFSQMSNWSSPIQAIHHVVYKNKMGMKVVSFDYKVHYQAEGSYLGVGSYIAGLTTSAENINVSWGFDLDASSRLINVSNRGTIDDPIAGATIEIIHKVSTAFNLIESSERFHVTGVGEIIRY